MQCYWCCWHWDIWQSQPSPRHISLALSLWWRWIWSKLAKVCLVWWSCAMGSLLWWQTVPKGFVFCFPSVWCSPKTSPLCLCCSPSFKVHLSTIWTWDQITNRSRFSHCKCWRKCWKTFFKCWHAVIAGKLNCSLFESYGHWWISHQDLFSDLGYVCQGKSALNMIDNQSEWYPRPCSTSFVWPQNWLGQIWSWWWKSPGNRCFWWSLCICCLFPPHHQCCFTNSSWNQRFHWHSVMTCTISFSLLFNTCTTMCQSHDWHLFISYSFLLPIVLHKWLIPSMLLWLSAGIPIVLVTYCSCDVYCSSDVYCLHYSIVPIEYIVRPAK